MLTAILDAPRPGPLRVAHTRPAAVPPVNDGQTNSPTNYGVSQYLDNISERGILGVAATLIDRSGAIGRRLGRLNYPALFAGLSAARQRASTERSVSASSRRIGAPRKSAIGRLLPCEASSSRFDSSGRSSKITRSQNG